MYKIGELSKLCGLPVRTLRYYDSIGLLVPDEVDRFTGYRYYSSSKLVECNRIVAMKELGFSLEEIARQCKEETNDNILSLVNDKLAELDELIADIKTRQTKLGFIKKTLSEGDNRVFNAVIKEPEPIRIASQRKIFVSREEAYDAIAEMRRVIPDNLLGKRDILISYETEYKDSDFDIEVGVEILSTVPTALGYNDKFIDFNGKIISVMCSKEEIEATSRSLNLQAYEMVGQISKVLYEIYYEGSTVELRSPIKSQSEDYEFYDYNYTKGAFENDERVVGKWEIVDLVPELRHYSPDNRKCSNLGSYWLKDLYFLANGEGYWTFFGWSKGCIYYMNRGMIIPWKYAIERIGDEKLLVLYMNQICGDGNMQQVCLYRKSDSDLRSSKEIRIYDNIDLPYICDLQAVGRWVSVGYCKDIDDFLPGNQSREGLAWRSVEFLNCGKAILNDRYEAEWTKGTLINKEHFTASAYKVKTFDEKEYMFVQWKSGDYIYGGNKPYYYVFVKESN